MYSMYAAQCTHSSYASKKFADCV